MKPLINRLRNILILALCYGYALFRGRATKKILAEPKTVVVIHEGKLGDMVCATPVFRAIKEKYPACKVVVFGNALYKELLEGNNDVDEYEALEKGRVFKNYRKLKRLNADYAIILNPSLVDLAALFLAGVPCTAAPKIENGWSPYETKSYVILRKLAIAVMHRMGSYAPREYLKMLEPIGIFSNDTKKHLNFSSDAEQKVSAFLAEKGIGKDDVMVCISPFAGNPVKRWGNDRFAELIKRILNEHSFKMILVGGKNDLLEIKLDSFANRIINACGLFNLDQLKALISKMSVFISVDTGPIYIAEAFNVPTIDIIGPIDENEQPPRGPKNKIVVAKRKSPELYVMNARVYNKAEARRQVDAITVDQVMSAFKELVIGESAKK